MSPAGGRRAGQGAGGRGAGGQGAGGRRSAGRPSPQRGKGATGGRAPVRRPAQRTALGRRTEPGGLGGEQVEGRRSVLELLRAGRRQVRSVWLADGLDPSPQLDEIEAWAARRHVRIETVSRARLEASARTEAPQGVLAVARPVEPVPLEELCIAPPGGPSPFLVVVAGVTDPRNLGALMRSAECAGVTGIVLARHRAAHLSPTVAKVAAGAVEHLAFSLVGGIPAALARLGELGVWTVGLAAESPASLYDLPLAEGPIALVVGSEERGLPPLVRRRCDTVAAIPQHGTLSSLNVGVAAAVACFEVARRRDAGVAQD